MTTSHSTGASPASPSNHRRISSVSSFHRPRIQWMALVFVLACLVCQTTATRTMSANRAFETLLVDMRVPKMVDGSWVMMGEEEAGFAELRKRATTTTKAATTKVAESVGTATGTLTQTFSFNLSSVAEATATAASTTAAATSALPSPLEGNLSSNFSSGCSTFINAFLSDPTFKQCYPFSLLLQGSKSFFAAAKSFVSITQVIEATCTANVTFCGNYFTNLAANLTLAANCGTDRDKQNSVVVDAYNAMVAYAPIYQAACLMSQENSAYCFANAITNTTNVSDGYFYYLPLNVSLPAATNPTCNSCLQNTMAIYQGATANRQQLITNTYVGAAQQVNTICGPGFVNASLAQALVTTGGSSNLAPELGRLAVVLAVGTSLLLFV